MGKGLVITKEIAAKAILFGSCKVPVVGNRIEQFSQSDLIWAEKILPIEGIKLGVPLWTLSGSGDGSGYGYGDGSGYGYGDGSGSGYGYGYGDGDGDGYGYGDRDGSGYGYGDGSGYGYGDGSGSGDGDGSGYGDGDGKKYEQLPSLLN